MGQNPYTAFNNDLGAIATLTAATANGNSADFTNALGKGVKIVVDVTAMTGTSPTITVTIQGKDEGTGQYYTLLASAAISATGVSELTVYPGITATSNVSASDHVPATWRVSWTLGGTTPAITAVIGACLLA